MTVVKLPGRRITLECDECSEELDLDYSDHSLGFKEMIEAAKSDFNWTVTLEDNEWVHRCDNCSEVGEESDE